MDKASEQSYSFRMLMNIINSITHWILGGLTMIAFSFVVRYSGVLAENLKNHVYLCVIGYFVLMAQAVLVFSPNNGWSQNMTDSDRRLMHWTMQIVGSTLALAGSILRMTGVTSNFSSAHGIFGFIAMIFTCISLIGGLVGFITKKDLITKFLHPAAGCVTLVAAFITICIGFDKLVFRVLQGDTMANLGIAFAVFGLVGTLCSAAMTGVKRIRLIVMIFMRISLIGGNIGLYNKKTVITKLLLVPKRFI